MLRTNISVLYDYALSKNGKLLSTEYDNNATSVLWECEKGHQWNSRWINIKSGNWCKQCTYNLNRDSIQELIAFSKNKNGFLLSIEYKNCDTKLDWQCEKQHTWSATWYNVKNGTWCPKCAVKKPKKYTVEILQFFAKKRNGVLLSTEYCRDQELLSWQCDKLHTWETSWNNVKNGTWCPKCSTLKSEKECIKIAETILNMPLVKKRIYLSSENKKQYLEFDGYNEEQKIAVEYNGIQHYKYIPHFHRDKRKKDFTYQQQRDELKRNYCKQNGIFLIEVPYTVKNISMFVFRLYQDSK